MTLTYPTWTGQEPCRQAPDLFWPETRVELDDWRAMLQGVCAACPSLDACRAWALRHEEHGWWGGLSPQDRVDVRRASGALLEPVDYYAWIPRIVAGEVKRSGAA